MKKISYLLLGLALLVGATACSDDEYQPKVNSVEVTSADTYFQATGGEKEITVTGSGITATSGASWLTATVSGNTVKLQAAVNADIQSRNTTVVIKASNGDATTVNVSQLGDVVKFEYPTDGIKLNDADTTVTFKADAILPITVKSAPDWVKVSIDKGVASVKAQANNLGHIREGVIVLDYQGTEFTVPIRQFDIANDFYGSCMLIFTDPDSGKDSYLNGIMTSYKGNTVFYIPDEKWIVPVTVDEKDATLKISAGQLVGTKVYQGAGYYVGTVLHDSVSNTSTYATTSYIIGQVKYNAKNAYSSVSMVDPGTWSATANSLDFNLFTSSDLISSNSIDYWYRLVDPMFVRFDPTEEEATSAKSRNPYVTVNGKQYKMVSPSTLKLKALKR